MMVGCFRPLQITLTVFLLLLFMTVTASAADISLSQILSRAQWQVAPEEIKSLEGPHFSETIFESKDNYFALSYAKEFYGRSATLDYVFLNDRLIRLELSAPVADLGQEQVKTLFQNMDDEIKRLLQPRRRTEIVPQKNAGQIIAYGCWVKDPHWIFLEIDMTKDTTSDGLRLALFDKNEPANETLIGMIFYVYFKEFIDPAKTSSERSLPLLPVIAGVAVVAVVFARRYYRKFNARRYGSSE